MASVSARSYFPSFLNPSNRSVTFCLRGLICNSLQLLYDTETVNDLQTSITPLFAFAGPPTAPPAVAFSALISLDHGQLMKLCAELGSRFENKNFENKNKNKNK